jgi:hypothetical protein
MSTLYRYLPGDLRNVALPFLGAADGRALNLSSGDPKFKQCSHFHPIGERIKDKDNPWPYRTRRQVCFLED